MYISLTRYLREFSLEEPVVAEHWRYQDAAYERGELVCSGPRIPSGGGVIILRTDSEQVARQVMDADPLVVQGVVGYDLVRFRATRAAYPDLVEQ